MQSARMHGAKSQLQIDHGVGRGRDDKEARMHEGKPSDWVSVSEAGAGRHDTTECHNAMAPIA